MLEGMTAPSEFNIRVICRFRPMSDVERKANISSITKFPQSSDDTVFVGGRVYVFDKVFGPNVSQRKVYDEAARQIVADILNGYNGTIFAYGQTASGKTHTMEGSLEDDDQQGIIPRIVSDIFDHIYSMSDNLQFQIKVSYFEIYMDKIRDLLNTNKNNLAVHEDKNRVPYVKGCTERFVASPEEVFEAIEEGKANRHVAVTNMNEHSSRSHSVFLIDVKQENLETDKKLTGRLYMVDLAGSEKVSKTGAEGSTLDEAKNINRSLSALGNVIAALADGTKSHVPYRDSKLTRILQESLGGNARTTVIICCSMTAFNECETKSTLYFGQRAKMIKNTVIVNEEVTAEEWKRRYDREHERVVRLRGQMAACERELLRWRSGQQVDESQMVDFQYCDSTIDESISSDSTMARFTPTSTAADQNLANHKKSANSRPRTNNYHLPSEHNIGGSSITDDERVLIVEKQCDALYRRLDEKDDDINQLEQRLNLSNQKQTESEDVILQLREQNQHVLNELALMQSENSKMREEIRELLSALQELAVKCDQKTVERNAEADKADVAIAENRTLTDQLTMTTNELNQLKGDTSYRRDYLQEVMDEIKKEFDEVLKECLNKGEDNGSVNISFQPCYLDELHSGNDVDSTDRVPTNLDSSSERAARSCKLACGQIKMEMKHMHERLELCNSKLAGANSTIAAQKNRIEENNSRIRDLTARLARVKDAKEDVESQLKALEQSNLCSAGNTDKGSSTQAALDSQATITRLECELSDKRKAIDEYKERASVLLAANQDLQEKISDISEQYNKKVEEADELLRYRKKQERSKSELLALESIVASELANLQQIRKIFVDNMRKRAQMTQVTSDQMVCISKRKNSASGVDPTTVRESPTQTDETAKSLSNESNAIADSPCELTAEQSVNGRFTAIEMGEARLPDRCGSIVQKQKIEFLEDNLKSITTVYRDLIKENADLKLEIPKLEKRLTATYERLRNLENALTEAKESATKDRKKYMLEVNRIREAVRNRQMGPRRYGNTATIVKPIKGGGAGITDNGFNTNVISHLQMRKHKPSDE